MKEDEETDEQEVPPAAVSREMPVVILGEEESHPEPRKRLLQGRIQERWVLYPAYALQIIAGAFALGFALNRPEWSIVPVIAGWSLLYVWTWFYGVAFRYRRVVLKYFSVLAILGVSGLLAIFCVDRAAEQVVYTPQGIVTRGYADALIWSAVITIVAVVLVMSHVVFLGRGYREKRVRGTDRMES